MVEDAKVSIYNDCDPSYFDDCYVKGNSDDQKIHRAADNIYDPQIHKDYWTIYNTLMSA